MIADNYLAKSQSNPHPLKLSLRISNDFKLFEQMLSVKNIDGIASH